MAKKTRYAVETLTTFADVHIVFAENEEEAKKIAENSDYNTSKFLGLQFIRTQKCSDEDLKRYKAEDKYFFEGAAKIIEENTIVYTDLSGKKVNNNMPQEILS